MIGQIRFNQNKLSSFVYLLKLKIDTALSNDEINDDVECLEFIRTEVTNSPKIFNCENEFALNNVVCQIFNFYYDSSEESQSMPLTEQFKNLSKLN